MSHVADIPQTHMAHGAAAASQSVLQIARDLSGGSASDGRRQTKRQKSKMQDAEA